MSSQNERNKSNLIPSLFETIRDPKAIDLLVDHSEIVIDAISESNLIDDIPIFGSIVKISRLGIGIRDIVFFKKVAVFLFELSTISLDERVKFINDITNNIDIKQKVGEKILLLLEQADDLNKPKLIGKLFVCFLKNEIDYETFSRIATGINKVSIERIEEVDNDFYIEFTEQVKKPFTTKYHIVRINENESLLKSEISIYNLLLVTFTGERLFSYLLIIFFSMLISLKLLAFILIILLLIFFFSILSSRKLNCPHV